METPSGYTTPGVNHFLEISGNHYKKSEISSAFASNPFEKREISNAKCGSDLPLDTTVCSGREVYGTRLSNKDGLYQI